MVKVLKKLLCCSFVLISGSAFSMNKQSQSGHSVMGKRVEQPDNGPTQPRRVDGLALHAQQNSGRTPDVLQPFNPGKNIQSVQSLNDKISELQEERDRESSRFARGIFVAGFTAWRMFHYATNICKIVKRNDLITDGKCFGTCIAAGCLLAFLDYNAPKEVGIGLGVAGFIDCMYSNSSHLLSWLQSTANNVAKK